MSAAAALAAVLLVSGAASGTVWLTSVAQEAPPAVEQPAPVEEGVVEVSDCLAAVWAAQEARQTGAWSRFDVLAESCEAGEVDRG